MRPAALLERAIARWLMRPACVSAVTTLSAHFRLIDFEGEALKDCAWAAGQKIQVKLDGGLATRTYTPIHWDDVRGATRILVYAHGTGPGSEWVRTAVPGAEHQIFGPRRSMDLDNLPHTAVLFGDETSFGLAAALQMRLDDRHEVRPVFEVSSLGECKQILDALAIDADVIERRPAERHWSEVKRVIEAFLADATLFILSGKARSIQFVSRVLKANGIPLQRLRTKAHWAPDRTGLD